MSNTTSTLFNALFLLFVINWQFSSGAFDPYDVASGVKMSSNEYMTIVASNTYLNFVILIDPFNVNNPDKTRCSMQYNDSDIYVHSVAVVGNERRDSDALVFAFSAEQNSTMSPFVCVISVSKSTCTPKSRCLYDALPKVGHQDFFLLDVDYRGEFAYGFTSSFVFKLEISSNKLVKLLNTSDVWPSFNFIPRALDLAKSWAFVAGYGYVNTTKRNYGSYGCLINITTLVYSTCIALVDEKSYLVPTEVQTFNKLYDISASIRDRKIVVGIHRLNTVLILEQNGTELHKQQTHIVTYDDSSSFGRTVDWADNKTIAVSLYQSSKSEWSKSQIYFFDDESVSSSSAKYTFPNNQQILGTRLSKPSFARFVITRHGNMVILTEFADILVVPIAPLGTTSAWTNPLGLNYVFYYEPRSCIGGTFKNASNLGPCELCKDRTRNSGNSSITGQECIPCSRKRNIFCPIASLVELDLNTVPSYTQALAYPENPDTTDIEEILLNSIFTIQANSYCIMASPLIWASIVVFIAIIIWIIMCILKYDRYKRFQQHREQVKDFLKHVDVIGEGELWIGGLISFSIFILVAFSYWFSATFFVSYPIESASETTKIVCTSPSTNAKFSTTLELMSMPKSNDIQPIFDLLDQQPFRLQLDLLNTGFACGSITAQENLYGTMYALLHIDCNESVANATVSVVLDVPKHYAHVQINMTGPHWIGGFRLCMFGEGIKNNTYSLRSLDFCELYYENNYAMSRWTTIPIEFVKTINITKPLRADNDTLYSGLWIPTFTSVELSDEPYYRDFGDYLRYKSSQTVIEIILSENRFYVRNTEEPIVRGGQMLFNALLFTFLCIDIFAFAFLLFKLLAVPVIAQIQRRCLRR